MPTQIAYRENFESTTTYLLYILACSRSNQEDTDPSEVRTRLGLFPGNDLYWQPIEIPKGFLDDLKQLSRCSCNVSTEFSTIREENGGDGVITSFCLLEPRRTW